MLGTIELLGMEFHSYHGCLENERREGARYLVDFSCRYDISRAVVSDNLSDTLDYGDIYDIVADQMSVPSNLLENVAGRIVGAIRAAHPEILSFKVKVSKQNPPVNGPAAFSSVTIESEKHI